MRIHLSIRAKLIINFRFSSCKRCTGCKIYEASYGLITGLNDKHRSLCHCVYLTIGRCNALAICRYCSYTCKRCTCHITVDITDDDAVTITGLLRSTYSCLLICDFYDCICVMRAI